MKSWYLNDGRWHFVAGAHDPDKPLYLRISFLRHDRDTHITLYVDGKRLTWWRCIIWQLRGWMPIA